jgi:hypothetical protein
MAKMIPNFIEFNPKIKGEIEIFNLLKNSRKTENWIVMHSIEVSQHISQVSGEIDFVIIVPHSGVLCVEVKGVKKVSRDKQGNWQYGSSSKLDRRGPFKQASDAMHSLINYIKDAYPEAKNILFWYGVFFPFCPFDIISPEWESWQVIDQKKLKTRDIGEIIYEMLSYAKMYAESKNVIRFREEISEPSLHQCDVICKILRPSFDFSASQETNCYTNRNTASSSCYNGKFHSDIHTENNGNYFRRLSDNVQNDTQIGGAIVNIINNFAKSDESIFGRGFPSFPGVNNYQPIYDVCNKIARTYDIELINSNDKMIVQKIITLVNPILSKEMTSDNQKSFIPIIGLYYATKVYKQFFSMKYGIGNAISYYIKQLYTKAPMIDDDIIVAYEMGKLLGEKKYKK